MVNQPSRNPAPSPDAAGDNPQLEAALDSLRDVWRNGNNAELARQRALRQIHELKAGSPTHEAERVLTRQMQRLQALPPDLASRRHEVMQVAGELKALQPFLETTRTHEYGKLTTAIRQPKPAHKTPPARETPARPLRLEDLVETVPGIGPKNAALLGNMQIRTVADLLRHIPREHIDYAHPDEIGQILHESRNVVYRGILRNVREVHGRGKPRVEAQLRDHSGTINLVWFSTYIAKQLHDGDEIVVRGALKGDRFGLQLSPVEFERADHPEIAEGRLLPVYPLTKGLTQKRLRAWVRTTLELVRPHLTDWLAEIRPLLEQVAGLPPLMPLEAAWQHLHFPDSREQQEAAQRRMAFDSSLLLQVGLIQRKAEAKSRAGRAMPAEEASTRLFLTYLPFTLTDAQQSAAGEILGDLRQSAPMTRLLQGDVGTGKTVVAALAAFIARENGYQTALMAPTEILAEQHYRSFSALFAGLPEAQRPGIALLTGSTKAKDRREIDVALQSGATSVLVGTHAIIEERVQFQQLGLVVIDEQHRFGVHQRGLLMQKALGYTPHVLSMTATPIPKTLNHVVNGELDVSIIDQRPPGRVEIETILLENPNRAEAELLIRREVAAGHQVFVICPLVDEKPSDPEAFVADAERSRSRQEAKAAVTEAERLQAEVFRKLRVTVVHGQMPSKKKDEVMTAFRGGEYDILVATSVIEVGIDIPNATVIMIEGADRFGLAQLHQLRGRVGRGNNRSYCLLIADDASANAYERLQAMVATTDGFVLAQKDLELRGPGDFIGTRQSGMPEMDWLGSGFDSRLLDQARRVAERIVLQTGNHPEQQYPQLGAQLARFWATTESLDTTRA